MSPYERDDLRKVGPSSIPSEEVTLLQLARSGDPSAFESLVLPHGQRLLRVTGRILRNREDAEDAVQNALLDAFRNLNRFEGRSRFSTWLTQIAKNAAFMHLRVSRRKREISLDGASDTDELLARLHPAESRPNPEQQYLLDEGRVLLQQGIERLDPLYAEVLHLRSVGEFSAKEAAGLLEVPVGTVKARLHRARVKLIRHTQKMLKQQRRVYPVKSRYVGMPMSRDSLLLSRIRQRNGNWEDNRA